MKKEQIPAFTDVVVRTNLEEPKNRKKFILLIISTTLLLNSMLYMVMVPIIPDYLRKIGAWDTYIHGEAVTEATRHVTFTNQTGNYTYDEPPRKTSKFINGVVVYEQESWAIGILFASKPMIQLVINPFSGALIDRIGYDKPLMIGLTIMLASSAVFAFGKSYIVLFLARCLQGVGSAFADTSGLALIAALYPGKTERPIGLGVALAFISFGCLVAPPFGGLLYELVGKEIPFLIVSGFGFAGGIFVWLALKPIQIERPKPTPIWKLFVDPYILVCSGALIMSNISLAFLESTISIWMMDSMHVSEWPQGMIWLPAIIPHIVGILVTVLLAARHPQYAWILAAIGLALEGLSCILLPFATTNSELMTPIKGIWFGIALITAALLPTMGNLVDLRHASVYGSIFAIVGISYAFPYAFGPLVAEKLMVSFGFVAVNIGIGVSNLIYVPVLIILRHIYD